MGTAQGGGTKGKAAKGTRTAAAATGGEKSWVQMIDELRAQVNQASDGEVQARSRLESVLDRVERVFVQANRARASLIAMSIEASGETTRMALAANANSLERAVMECQQLLQGCGRAITGVPGAYVHKPAAENKAYEMSV